MAIMDDKYLAIQSFELIQKDFGLEEKLDITDERDPFVQLKLFLTKVIQYLIDHDFSRLINTLYRIDISESKVKEIMEIGQPDDMAENLAVEIIEREKKKVLTRIKYS